MKTPLLPACLALVLFAQGGCMIPLGRNLHSERELGRRGDTNTQGQPAIVLRVIKERTLSPLTENGYGKDYVLWNQYYLRRGAEETRLRFLEIGAIEGMMSAAKDPHNTLRDIEPEVRPIQGTTSWIAIRVRKVEQAYHYSDVEFIVFDEALQHREITIERIKRRPVRTFIEILEYAGGNRQIFFQKDDGRYVLDLLTFEIKKL
jgi:hypothetical protein